MDQNLLPPSLDTWTALFLLAAGNGFFLATTLYLSKKGNRRANAILGTFIFLFALMLVDFVAYWTRYNSFFPEVSGIYAYMVLLFGPLLYLYLREVNGAVSKRSDLMHFLPALVFLFLHKGLEWSGWFPSFKAYFYFEATLYIGHLAGYGILAHRYLTRLPEKVNWTGTGSPQVIQRWQRYLLWMYWGYVAGWLTYYMVVGTSFFSLLFDYGIALSMTVFIYTVGYLGYRQPEVFEFRVGRKPFRKYQNSSLTDKAAMSMRRKIDQFMETEKPYLDNDLRLNKLARKIGISPHHLSQVVNEQYGKTFSDFINDYRVKAVRQMLGDPSYKDAYLINIAYEAGFNNKTTFNKIFKAKTGLSPSEYRMKINRARAQDTIAANN